MFVSLLPILHVGSGSLDERNLSSGTWAWQIKAVVLQHQLEIMIDHRLESVGASDVILPIIIGC